MQSHLVLKPLSETYGVTVGVTITELPTIPADAVRAKIQVEVNDIRARFDGTNSVTTGTGGGILLPVNTIACPVHVVEGYDNLSRMRMRCQGTTVSKINVVFEGEGQPS